MTKAMMQNKNKKQSLFFRFEFVESRAELFHQRLKFFISFFTIVTRRETRIGASYFKKILLIIMKNYKITLHLIESSIQKQFSSIDQ